MAQLSRLSSLLVLLALARGPVLVPGTLEAQASPGAPLALVDVEVVDVPAGAVLPGRTVVVRGGRIASVEEDGPVPDDARPVDAAGLYLIPGIWDVHAHVRHPEAPSLILPQLLAHGVTGIRGMSSDCEEPGPEALCLDELRSWSRRIESGELLGPRFLALSSFPLNPPWDYEVAEEEARGLVRMLDQRGVDLIKTYHRLSPRAFSWVVEEAEAVGLPVAGHIPLRMTAREASDAGLWSLEHARDFLFDCFPGSAEFRREARSQNPPLEVMAAMVNEHRPEVCAETFRTFVENGTAYVPTHVTRRMDALAHDPDFRNDPRRRFIWDEVWASWQEDADRMVELAPSPEGRRIVRGFYETGLELTGRAHDAGVRVLLGTDAGDTYVFFGSGAHDELGELVKAGLTPAEALAAATIEPARFLDREDDHGSVEVGKVADLVLLRANPLEAIGAVREIEAVIFGGRFLDRERLDRALDEVAERILGM